MMDLGRRNVARHCEEAQPTKQSSPWRVLDYFAPLAITMVMIQPELITP
jgi:hypothetical protein